MKPICTSTYTFSDLIRGGFLYVDKTAEIETLIHESKGQYFLSRPRRFGKSLLISTLESIFLGKRELFKGLAIDSLGYDWTEYPVIRLDMGSTQSDSPDELVVLIEEMLHRVAAKYGVGLEQKGKPIASQFISLITDLAEQSPQGKVVILVDEYDKPLLNHIGTADAIQYRNILKAFYSVIKTTEGLQRFAFITGVSKFSKVSIFSDLNNLTDITMSMQYATLLGYTREEMETYFSDRLPMLADAIGKSEEETFRKLEYWYDGFRFSRKEVSVFNPVSIGKCFLNLDFNNYWFDTATPTFLLDLLKKTPMELHDLKVPESSFSVYEIENPAILPLLVQTGYLTIKGWTERGDVRRYQLEYPNFEVRSSFESSLLEAFSESRDGLHVSTVDAIIDALEVGDLKTVFYHLSSFFARIPNTITLQHEKYYQAILYVVFDLIGTIVRAEVSTNIGRVDAVVETDSFVTIFEFKLHDTAQAAMDQIHEKEYYKPYLTSGKKILLVGVAFDPKTRNLGEYLMEEMDSVR